MEIHHKDERRWPGISHLLNAVAPAFDGAPEFRIDGGGQIDDETIARAAEFTEIVGDQDRAFLDEAKRKG